MVSPKVAAAAAQRALEVLGEDDLAVLAEARQVPVDENGEQKEAAAGADAGNSETKEQESAAEGEQADTGVHASLVVTVLQ